jgi:hypothetical protein
MDFHSVFEKVKGLGLKTPEAVDFLLENIPDNPIEKKALFMMIFVEIETMARIEELKKIGLDVLKPVKRSTRKR